MISTPSGQPIREDQIDYGLVTDNKMSEYREQEFDTISDELAASPLLQAIQFGGIENTNYGELAHQEPKKDKKKKKKKDKDKKKKGEKKAKKQSKKQDEEQGKSKETVEEDIDVSDITLDGMGGVYITPDKSVSVSIFDNITASTMHKYTMKILIHLDKAPLMINEIAKEHDYVGRERELAGVLLQDAIEELANQSQYDIDDEITYHRFLTISKHIQAIAEREYMLCVILPKNAKGLVYLKEREVKKAPKAKTYTNNETPSIKKMTREEKNINIIRDILGMDKQPYSKKLHNI